MASQIKHKVAKNLYEALHNKTNVPPLNDFFGRFQLLRSTDNHVVWKVTLPDTLDTALNSEFFRKSQQELLDEGTVKNVILGNMDKTLVNVEVDVKHFIKDVLDSDPRKLNYQCPRKKIIFEFSSPNIAKPFHVGHLRSTIIGNCLANIKKKIGNDVVKINFLGDWGTQYGMVQLGMNLENYTEEDLKKDPLKTLLKAYIKGNIEAEKDAELHKQAMKIFFDLEFEKGEVTELWNKCRKWTSEELMAVYKRLGVSFDEYNWESDYRRFRAHGILEKLEQQGILHVDKKDRKVAIINGEEIPLLKSDGTSLYILRDLMAVEDRRSKHKFDEMYYVVDNGQSKHFASLMELCSELKFSEGVKMEHVKFGRVHGMSTRKGKITFLNDVLNEGRDLLYEQQIQSKTTKASLENNNVADILAVSAVIVNDLKLRRLKDYTFSWEKALQFKGDTGVSIQYCHTRLTNIQTESGCTPASECDPEALMEPAAVNLIMAIARYEETVWNASEKLEPCTLVKYVFDLIKATNVAYKELAVKNADQHVGSQRLLMFIKSRDVLNEAMRLIGIQPLGKM